MYFTFFRVVVMHQSFVTTAPAPGEGGGYLWKSAVFLLLHCPAVRGKYKGYRQTRQYNIVNCRGKGRWLYQFGRVWLDRKSKSPLFPRGWGPWLQMTGALSVIISMFCIIDNQARGLPRQEQFFL